MDSFDGFDEDDCLRVAFNLRVPLKADGTIPVPVWVEVSNPNYGACFVRMRIQSVREELDEDGQWAPFTEDDEPFDENYGPPFFVIYGVDSDGLLDLIAERTSYDGARALLLNLMPELRLPERVIAFETTNFTNFTNEDEPGGICGDTCHSWKGVCPKHGRKSLSPLRRGRVTALRSKP